MSPLSSKCVWASTKPGSTVAFERSMTCTPAGTVPAVVTETIWSPAIRISALTTGASLLPSIKRPARMAIFGGVGFSFSCAETGYWAEIKSEIPIAAAATKFGRIVASRAAARVAQALSGCRERREAYEKEKGQPESTPVGLCALAAARKLLIKRNAPLQNRDDARAVAPFLPQRRRRGEPGSPRGDCSPPRGPRQLPNPSAACTN